MLTAVISCTVSAADVDYLRDIKPVLKAKCYSCHGAMRQEAELRVDTVDFMRKGGDSGPALNSGEELTSRLLQRITARDESERMPPEGETLSPLQIERVKAWLAGGAKAQADELPQADPKSHWAFQPLQKTAPPAGDHPLDAFIHRRLAAAGLHPAAPAGAVDLVRRMFLDLHGLPPTPEQIDRWTPRVSAAVNHGLPAGGSAGSLALIEHLLSSPRYGERWGQHWLDVVRYADTHGYEVNTPRPNAWPYRDYVIKAFNEDRSYERFAFEQLAGDTVGEDAATGFLVAAAALLPGQIGADDESKRLARQDELDEIIMGTSATFLGLTVGCARCHDHKFDPIPQADYYAMQAFFAGVEYGDREIRCDDLQVRTAQADRLQPEIDELRRRVNTFRPKPFTGRTVIIDDEDTSRVTLLRTKNGHGTNPEGAGRGYRGDTGDDSRLGNLSGSRYTWWNNQTGEDIFTWNPGVAGRFRLWISWGVHGSGVHTRDARYVLDSDGDLASKDDQKTIAQADQYYFAGVDEGESVKKPLWSGLRDTGIHDFATTTRLVLRGGDTGTGITADVMVLQEQTQGTQRLPRLRAPVTALTNFESFAPVTAKFVRFTSFETIGNDKHEPCIDELEVFTAGNDPTNVALAKHGTKSTSSGNYSNSGKHQLNHINDGILGNSHSWISNEAGKGWVQLEFLKAETIDRIQWSRDREGKFHDRLTVRYQIETSVDGQSWTIVARSDDRVPIGTPHDDLKAMLRNRSETDGSNLPELVHKLRQLESQQAELRTPQMVFAGKFRTPHKTFVLKRGDPEQPSVEISPHVLTSIGSVRLAADAPDQQRRAALARWITSPDNPLTARVMVNRVWQYHFGIGLVDTPSDFGLNGERPSHPELLDWLAQEFIASGWSVKHLHRLIMSSATYQQSAVGRSVVSGSQAATVSGSLTPGEGNVGNNPADPVAVDAGNRLLWRFPSRRLEAEAIRDSMLHISGQLNLKMGGAGFDFFKSRGGLSGFPPKEKFTEKERRRMIYAHKIRMEPVPVFGAFDCPDAGLPAPKRSQSTTAIQALNLFNSSFAIDQAQVFAMRVENDAGDRIEEQIDLAFLLAVGRHPSAAEKPMVLKAVRAHGLSTLCRALFNSSEFLFIP